MIDNTNNFGLNFNAKYLVPMSKIDRPLTEEELVECEIREGGKPFEMGCFRDGYRTKRLYKSYFAYLVEQGYAKKIPK